MSFQESNRRIKTAKLACSINQIEGTPISPSAKLLFTLWTKGKITGAEIKADLLNKHRNTVSN